MHKCKGCKTTIYILVGLTKESVTAKGGRDLLNDATPALREFGEQMVAAYKDGKISEEEKKELMKKGKGIDEKFSKAFGKGVDIFKKLGNYAKDFPGEVMKAIDAATESLEGQTGEYGTSSTQAKSRSEEDILNQKDKNIMNSIQEVVNKKSDNPQQPVTNNNQNVSTTNNTQNTNNNLSTTNNTTTNTNYDQKTFIDQTQKATSKMASNSNLFDLSPMVNLQGEQLTASKGSLTELQTLNSNINKSNETLISYVSNLDSKDINKIEVKIPEQTGIESQKPTIEGNEQSVQTSEMITNNITNNSLAQQITNPMSSTQNNTTSFDGKLTIDVNITAPPGVDTAAIKEVVTQTMYDSKVRENISKSMINPKIGSYNPTTGIPT